MAGGLIQLVISDIQDTALTYDPQITFFKKKYKRHTNFSTEFKQIYSDQEPSFENKISFTLSNNCDLIHRCFVQITIPSLEFTDTIITNQNYITWKNDYIYTLNNKVTLWNNLYINLKNYASIELILYQELLTLFMSNNLVLDNIKQIVIKFNNTYKLQINNYSSLIDVSLYNKINMSGYLLSLNLLLTYDLTLINSNYISITTIQNKLKTMYNSILEYLSYYHSNWQQLLKTYNNFINNKSNINFAWTQYLGHYFFTHFELNIGGQIIDQYSSDQFHIYQYHHLTEDQINNYNMLIGQDIKLIEFNCNSKPSKILLIPLLFFFNKNSGSALPLVAMRNTTVTVTLTLNKLQNLIYFRDYETEYNNLLVLTIPFNNKINDLLNYNSYKYILKTKEITYNLKNLNYTALQLIYPQLNDNDINTILNYSTSNNILSLIDWINFKNNLINYPLLINKIGGYDMYIDYNYLLNLIPSINIILLAEYVYLDDVERKKMTTSKLEYVIEGFQENIFDINNLLLYDSEISIDRPNKYFKWFIQPKNFLYGLSEYGKVTPYIFEYSKYYSNKIFDKQYITLNQNNIINDQLDDSYYKIVQPYQTLNRILPDGIYYYSYSLYPEELQPSGTVNLSAVREKRIRFELNPLFLTEYFSSILNPNNVGLQGKLLSISYNFFVIQNGYGKIIFSIN
jgi:hypothetical protein